jgi:hypothetical protein
MHHGIAHLPLAAFTRPDEGQPYIGVAQAEETCCKFHGRRARFDEESHMKGHKAVLQLYRLAIIAVQRRLLEFGSKPGRDIVRHRYAADTALSVEA